MKSAPLFARAPEGALRRSLFALLLCAACGDDPDSQLGEADAAVYEGCPTTTPEFALGMQASGDAGRIRATLLDAEPAPPMRYLNDWSVSFETPAGAPLLDVEILMARPFMPVHGHYGNPKPTLVRNPDDGSYRIENLNLMMRGPWAIQLQLRSPSAGDDYLEFHVCVVQ